jgi:hypothetical protein
LASDKSNALHNLHKTLKGSTYPKISAIKQYIFTIKLMKLLIIPPARNSKTVAFMKENINAVPVSTYDLPTSRFMCKGH